MPEILLRAVAEWASEHPSVLAVALVGSHAGGTARPDSDVDLVLIVTDPERFFANEEWIDRFGAIHAVRDEDWGRVRSRRVHYAAGLEVEFGLASHDWANTDPVDPGTKEVVAGGLRCIYDPAMLLRRLVDACDRGTGLSRASACEINSKRLMA